MQVSVGITAYNEGKNIDKLLNSLLKQKPGSIQIKEIIVVSSGSSDNTEKIVEKFGRENDIIKLIKEDSRRGKVSAINEFITESTTENLVLMSADIIPRSNFIEKIAQPLKDNGVGIVACRPVPITNANNLLNFTVKLQWALNDRICRKKPKFGEAIAFRKVFKCVPPTSVDEEYIAMIIKRLGLKATYKSDAIIYNKGPETIEDFILQRRRIYSGHLKLAKKGYKASSLDYALLFKEAFNSLKKKDLSLLLGAMLLEATGRFLGKFDNIRKKEHIIWDVAKSTKYFEDEIAY